MVQQRAFFSKKCRFQTQMCCFTRNYLAEMLFVEKNWPACNFFRSKICLADFIQRILAASSFCVYLFGLESLAVPARDFFLARGLAFSLFAQRSLYLYQNRAYDFPVSWNGIEILSPVNKRSPGLEAYIQKRRRMHQGGVHFLEIDLLRRGARTIRHPQLPLTAYLVSLTRAGVAKTDIWPIALSSPLPIVPVPLTQPDKDVPLDLAQALKTVYEEAAYHLSINYAVEPPSPALSEKERVWLKGLNV